MSRKAKILRRTLEACLEAIGYARKKDRYLDRFTILETDDYVRRGGRIQATDIVITSGRIEVHEYSTDPKEPYFRTVYDDFRSFVSAFAQERIGQMCKMRLVQSAAYREALREALENRRYEELFEVQSRLTNDCIAEYTVYLEMFLNSGAFRAAERKMTQA